MHGIEHPLLPVVAAAMTRQFLGAIEDAQIDSRGRQR
jgi:hypothetical protein